MMQNKDLRSSLTYGLIYGHPQAFELRHATARYILDEGGEVDDDRWRDLLFKNRHLLGSLAAVVHEHYVAKLKEAIANYPNKRIVGLTGGSGAGKGEVAKIFAAADAEIICVDSIAHRVMRKGESPAFKMIVDAFGEAVLGDDGEICRRKLREIVFVNKDELKRLTSIVHPYIVEWILEAVASSEKRLVLIDAPLLIPSGLNEYCHHVLGVFAPLDMRISRICARDGLTLEDAQARLNNQMLDEELRQHVEFEIENDARLEELHEKVHKIIDVISNRFGN